MRAGEIEKIAVIIGLKAVYVACEWGSGHRGPHTAAGRRWTIDAAGLPVIERRPS